MRIEVKNLCKIVDRKYLVKNINLTFESGQIYGIIGQNGSGKTVLFKLLLGLMNKSSGEILVDGKKQNGFMRDVGFIIERPNLIPYYSAYDNLKFISSYSGKVDKQKIIQSLEMVGLSSKEKKKVKNYSLGMKQKVAIAMAIMDDPKILILDEPLNAIDDSSVKKIREIILEYKKNDRIVLIASHYKDDIDYLCDEVYEMKNGEIIDNNL
ncbi:MAG: ABC transporter ATP-binding protein [Lachnospiraceae bacterium]|nr:ABC transporter ATP-binding protein [Lachnospiraceae bacterium]